MVREFQQTREQHLIVILDLFLSNNASSVDRERIELAISFAATICVEQLTVRRGSQLSLMTNGESAQFWDAQSSGTSMESLLDLLAIVQAGSADHLAEITDRCLQSRSPQHQIVLVTTRQNERGTFKGLDDQDAHQGLAESGIPMQIIEADAKQLSMFFALR